MVGLLDACDTMELTLNRVDDAPLAIVYPKKSFMTGALEKEIRLSFARRIRGTLPEPYHPLISEAKEMDRPDFKYETDRMLDLSCRKLVQIANRRRNTLCTARQGDPSLTQSQGSRC